MPYPKDTEDSLPQCIQPPSTDALWMLLSTPHPAIGKARHLGEALLHAGLITPAALASSLQTQQEERDKGNARPIGQILVEQHDLSQDQLRQVISTWLGEYMVDPTHLQPEPDALALVPRTVAERESVLPLLVRDESLALLMADPYDRMLLSELRFLTQRRLIPIKAAPGTLAPAIAKAYSVHPGDASDAPRGKIVAGGAKDGVRPPPTARATSQELAQDLNDSAPDSQTTDTDVVSESDNTLVRLINSIIDEAIAHRASDIHIETEPAPGNVRVRLRIDGDLVPYLELPARYRFAMVARIKIMASLDIAERRKPQDGKIKFKIGENKEIELRVATIPTAGYNEDVVMRILAASEPLPVDKMGFSDRNLREIKSIAEKPYGIILCVGPTGSGKTTTLYTLLGTLNKPDVKIIKRTPVIYT